MSSSQSLIAVFSEAITFFIVPPCCIGRDTMAGPIRLAWHALCFSSYCSIQTGHPQSEINEPTGRRRYRLYITRLFVFSGSCRGKRLFHLATGQGATPLTK